jgi:hypothetical protein
MIKPLNSPQLSAAKPRTGLQSIGELLPRLIRTYELQAELMQRREENARRESETNRMEAQREAVLPMPSVAMETEQATFAWYDESGV